MPIRWRAPQSLRRKRRQSPSSSPSSEDTSAAESFANASAPPPSGGNGHGYRHGERNTGKQIDFYVYRDARGGPYLGVKRTSTKQFPQFHWDGRQWRLGAPKGPKIPYRLSELLDALPEAWVVIAAGEKDAETAVAVGFVATTNSGGEGKGQWTAELGRWFSGKQRVAIMEDNDATGEKHAIEVANAVRGIVPDIRIVGFRELKKGGDLTDWIEADPQHDHGGAAGAHRSGAGRRRL
jgi:hypothetical protein